MTEPSNGKRRRRLGASPVETKDKVAWRCNSTLYTLFYLFIIIIISFYYYSPVG